MGKVLKIREIGDPVLSLKCKEVSLNNIDKQILDEIEDLKETLNFSGGMGISAPQIGINKKIVVINIDKEKCKYEDCEDVPMTVMLNPSFKKMSNETYVEFEACLSVPVLRGKVERYKKIELTYYNEKGDKVVKIVNGFTARIIQHECDHLNGINFIDKVIPGTFTTKENLIKYELK